MAAEFDMSIFCVLATDVHLHWEESGMQWERPSFRVAGSRGMESRRVTRGRRAHTDEFDGDLSRHL